MRKFLMVAIGLVLAGCGASVMPQIHSEAERLSVARNLMTQRDWAQASELLKQYVANNAGSADVDEAICLLGECELQIRDWAAAEIDFERLLRDYPESDSSAAAAYQLGEALFGQARGPDFDQEYTLKALQQWESYQRGYPGDWRQPQAARRIATARQRLATKLVKNGNLYLGLKLGDPARIYFQRVIDEYPETPQAGEATLGLALAEAISGKKDEAIERLKRIEAEFPGQAIAMRAAQERARLEK